MDIEKRWTVSNSIKYGCLLKIRVPPHLDSGNRGASLYVSFKAYEESLEPEVVTRSLWPQDFLTDSRFPSYLKMRPLPPEARPSFLPNPLPSAATETCLWNLIYSLRKGVLRQRTGPAMNLRTARNAGLLRHAAHHHFEHLTRRYAGLLIEGFQMPTRLAVNVPPSEAHSDAF